MPTGAVGSKTVSKRVAASTAAKKAADDILPGTVDSNVDQSVASVAGSHEDSFDEDVLDHEIAEMEKSILETQAKLEHLERASQVQSKKDKLSKMKARLGKNQQKLQAAAEKGEKKHSSSSKLCDDAKTTDSRVKAADLRDNVKLKKNANRKMKSLGLFSDNEQSVDSSSDSSSESSEGSVLSDSEHRHKPASKSHKSSRHYTYSESDRSGSSDSLDSSKKSRHLHKNKKRSKKSGMSKRASDRVKYPQVWPHTLLQYEFVSEHMSFKKLDMKMFFAAKLEILTSKISKSEFRGRLKFLKKIAYFTNIYDWSQLLNYYAAWLRRIEMGFNSWSDEPAQIENAVLASKMLRRKSDKGYLS